MLLQVQLPELEGLRGLAALAVVANHIIGQSSGHLGAISVSIFFCLSGYLITGILLRNQDNILSSIFHFWITRCIRLYPTLIINLLISGIFAYVISLHTLEEVFGFTWQAGLYLSNFFIDQHFGTYVAHYWTLGLEQVFYLFWPFCLSGLLLLSEFLRFLILGGVITLSAFWHQYKFFIGQENYAMKSIPCNIYGILAGTCLLLFSSSPSLTPMLSVTEQFDLEKGSASLNRLFGLKPHSLIDMALLSLLITYLCSLLLPTLSPLADILAVPYTILIILGATHLEPRRIINGQHQSLERHHWLLGSFVARQMGRFSYAWYLIHLPILSLTGYRNNPNWKAWVLGMISFGIAALFTIFVEEPLRATLKQKSLRNK